jgi:hypothetical protein
VVLYHCPIMFVNEIGERLERIGENPVVQTVARG